MQTHTQHTIHRADDITRNGVGSVMVAGHDATLSIDLDQYDELPIAANLALELLRAAAECETSDEPTTRQSAREALQDVFNEVANALGRLDAADAETAVGARS